MARPEKVEKVAELERKLKGSSLSLFTDFRGLGAHQMDQLRRQLRGAGVEYEVVKNRLLSFALEKAGIPTQQALLEGPTAVAFASGDEKVPARLIAEFLRATRSTLRVKGGVLGGRVISPEQVSLLPSLPEKGELAARLAGQLRAPLYSLVGALKGPLWGLTGVLQARIGQLEKGG